jgi:hypothetical protein
MLNCPKGYELPRLQIWFEETSFVMVELCVVPWMVIMFSEESVASISTVYIEHLCSEMEASVSSGTLVTTHGTTYCRNSEDHPMNFYRRDNLYFLHLRNEMFLFV